jgi:hypothetical protein
MAWRPAGFWQPASERLSEQASGASETYVSRNARRDRHQLQTASPAQLAAPAAWQEPHHDRLRDGLVAPVELSCPDSHRAHARAPGPRRRTGRRCAMPRLCYEHDVVLAWQLPGSGSTYAAVGQAHHHRPHHVQGLSGRALEARPGSGIAHPRGEECCLRARRGRDPRSATGASGSRRLHRRWRDGPAIHGCGERAER